MSTSAPVLEQSSSSNKAAIVSSLLEEASALRSKLDGIERDKLDYHISSLRELESRFSGEEGTIVNEEVCVDAILDAQTPSDLYDPYHFPTLCSAQLKLAVLAMECNITRVATIQLSHHTSELIMSRFPDTPMYDPAYDMRAHQASHYGSSHN